MSEDQLFLSQLLSPGSSLEEKSPLELPSTSLDFLHLYESPLDLFKLLGKIGGIVQEKLILSIKLTKLSRKEVQQTRTFLITDMAAYLLDGKKLKRRIPLGKLGGITSSNTSDEFVVHVPDEYDQRLVSAQKQDIIKCLRNVYRSACNKRLKLALVDAEQLTDVHWSEDKAKYIPREEQMKILTQMSAEIHESDEEEMKMAMNEFAQVFHDLEKVTVEDFDLIRTVGRGSFAKVLLVRKRDTQKVYAMKILKKEVLIARNQVEHTASERKFVGIAKHPFIIDLKFAFESPSKLYMVTEFYPGGELFFHLKTKRRFTEAEARFIIAELVLALEYIHSLGFVYRDGKPENIMLDRTGHIGLTDFGLSKEIGVGGHTSTFCGTPEYLAPEVLRGVAYGKEVDWWALGILLYEMTVGIPPFYSQNVNEMYHKIQHGALRFPPFLSQQIRNLITELLDRNPETRLGAGEANSEAIKAHPFFADINWENLYNKAVDPPYKPRFEGAVADDDTTLFDTSFTSMPPSDSPEPVGPLGLANPDPFPSFEYNEETKKL
eukprot:TRINITY_DN9241_c0_g1_i1.p1 TRINITY_DN9241_c0_g1~~TRINITY_DN9241_c0_g1_i1.p1  ORF type:complete len:548 (-),score=153.60 TRINITY_DN9241_c0_g1_i1:97-1740(-)